MLRIRKHAPIYLFFIVSFWNPPLGPLSSLWVSKKGLEKGEDM
jgi:hypothetical protein